MNNISLIAVFDIVALTVIMVFAIRSYVKMRLLERKR